MADSCTIFARDLEIMARVGIFPQEKKAAQHLIVNVGITFKRTRRKGKVETIKDIISYGDAVTIVKEVAAVQHWDLLETFGDEILDRIFKDKRVVAAEVTIEKTKPYSPVKGHMKGVNTLGVTLVRTR